MLLILVNKVNVLNRKSNLKCQLFKSIGLIELSRNQLSYDLVSSIYAVKVAVWILGIRCFLVRYYTCSTIFNFVKYYTSIHIFKSTGNIYIHTIRLHKIRLIRERFAIV